MTTKLATPAPSEPASLKVSAFDGSNIFLETVPMVEGDGPASLKPLMVTSAQNGSELFA